MDIMDGAASKAILKVYIVQMPQTCAQKRICPSNGAQGLGYVIGF